MSQVTGQTAPVIACAVSEDERTERAVDEVLQAVAPAMHGMTDLAIVFFTAIHSASAGRLVSLLHDALAPGLLLGVSAGGVVGNETEIEGGGGISLFAGRFPGVTIHGFTDRDIDWPATEHDTDRLREALGLQGSPRGLMLLADPFTPMTRFLPSVSAALPSGPDKAFVPVFGGIASSGRRHGENRFVFQDEVRVGGIVGASFAGNVRIDALVSQGCRPIGKPMVITTARHNMIESLSGRPAIEALQDTISELSESDRRRLQHDGLFVGRVVNEYQPRFGRGDFLIRPVIDVARNTGSVAVGDLVKVGQTIQFHVRDAQTAADDLEMLLSAQQLDDQPAGALLFTCNGRGRRFFGTTDHDVRMIRRFLPALPLGGFFAAGEIGSVGHKSYLHGHTASLALFRAMS